MVEHLAHYELDAELSNDIELFLYPRTGESFKGAFTIHWSNIFCAAPNDNISPLPL